MFNECRHIKSDGKRCHAAALRGKPYCFFHMKFDRIHKRERIEMPPIEDSTSILLAIGQVIRLLNYETVDCKRAGLMLYGLQIASGVAARREQAEAADTIPDTVRSVHDLEGVPLDFKEAFVFGADMLAPENSVCEPPNDCADCDKKNSCDKQKDVAQNTGNDRPDTETHDPEGAARQVREIMYGIMLKNKKANPESGMDPMPSRDEFHRCLTASAGAPS